MMITALFKKVFRKAVWNAKKKTIAQVLACRCRIDGKPENGRFTPGETKQIVLQAESNNEELMPYFKDLENLGNYQNEFVGLLDLAIYRALVTANIDRSYAMNLVGDMMWQAVVNSHGLVPIIDPLRKQILKFTIKDPLAYLGYRLKEMMTYPYSAPGYKVHFYMDNNTYCMDIYSCPVYDFYRQFGEEEMTMFRKTWCTFYYTAAQHVVAGGRYERKHALSSGDQVCDMRWFIDKRS
jgi:hypothetical protein